MNTVIKILLMLFFMSGAVHLTAQNKSAANEMVLVKSGIYKPLYVNDSSETSVKVNSFYMDKYAVTNEDFLKFVMSNPKWKKSKVKKLFADKSYLMKWKNDEQLGENILPQAPVTNVSWFAAKEYCECQGKRLPTVAEWEYAAQASETNPNGYADENYLRKILEWYSKPSGEKLPKVGTIGKNYWGIYDMHGLIWEWTQDFFSSLVTGESRGDSGLERNLFCGSGSVNSSDFKNYAAFMRFAFRSSLKANYTTANLGFRCVKDYHKNERVK